MNLFQKSLIKNKNKYKNKKMKTTKGFSLLKNVLFVLAVTAMVFAFNSCSKKTSFLTSTIIPAARGGVTVKPDKNKNNVITVSLTYLAEPARLTPPKKTYVIWLITKDGDTQNIGQIKSTNGLKVSFQTVSSFKPKKIFITAEDDGDLVYPASQVVLSTDDF